MTRTPDAAIPPDVAKLADDPIPEEWKSTPPATPKLSPDFDYWPMTVAKPGTPPATPDRVTTVLRELEWGGRGRAGIGGKYIANCPICGGPKEAMPAFDIPAGHQPDCSLAAALAAPSGNHPVGAVSDIDLVLDVLSAPTWDDEHQHQAAVERLCKVLASRPAPSVVTVTDNMIDRLCVAAFGEDEWKHMLASFDPAEFVIERMRAALEAALSPAPSSPPSPARGPASSSLPAKSPE